MLSKRDIATLKTGIPARKHIPILQHVLVQDRRVYATDMDLAVRIHAPDMNGSKGLVPFARLVAAAKVGPTVAVKVTPGEETHEEMVRGEEWDSATHEYPPVLKPDGTPETKSVTTRWCDYAVNAGGQTAAGRTDVDPTEYPDVAAVFPADARLIVCAPVKAFRETLEAVAPAMPTDETRFNLCGVCIEPTRAIATDGHRLVAVPLAGWAVARKDMPASMILPADLVRAVLSGLPRTGDVTLGLAGDRVVIECGAVAWSARLVDAVYPDVDQVIPAEQAADDVVCVFDPAATVKALTAALKMAGYTRSSAPPVRLTIAEGVCTLEVNQLSTDGEVRWGSPIPVAGEHRGSVVVGINGYYMLDALAACGQGAVSVRMTDDLSPIRLDANGRIAIVMPIRV